MSCTNSSTTSLIVSFIAGVAVGIGAILLVEQAMKESGSEEYETDQLFV
ncbi:MAG: hypothetical protein Fur0034_11880 [Desulfuromonadia bacterium]